MTARIWASVPSAHAVELAVSEVEGITRETLHDGSYKVDQSLLQTETGVFLRKEMASEEDLRNELTDELGLVEYAYVLYVDGEKVVATTFPGALDDILDQLKLGYQTEDTVDAYFVEDVEIRQEYVDTSYVMNLGYIAEILNETKEGEVTYTVKSGDSYYSIADEYGLSVDALMKLNPGYDPEDPAGGRRADHQQRRALPDGGERGAAALRAGCALPRGVHRRCLHVSGRV